MGIERCDDFRSQEIQYYTDLFFGFFDGIIMGGICKGMHVSASIKFAHGSLLGRCGEVVMAHFHEHDFTRPTGDIARLETIVAVEIIHQGEPVPKRFKSLTADDHAEMIPPKAVGGRPSGKICINEDLHQPLQQAKGPAAQQTQVNTSSAGALLAG